MPLQQGRSISYTCIYRYTAESHSRYKHTETSIISSTCTCINNTQTLFAGNASINIYKLESPIAVYYISMNSERITFQWKHPEWSPDIENMSLYLHWGVQPTRTRYSLVLWDASNAQLALKRRVSGASHLARKTKTALSEKK